MARGYAREPTPSRRAHAEVDEVRNDTRCAASIASRTSHRWTMGLAHLTKSALGSGLVRIAISRAALPFGVGWPLAQGRQPHQRRVMSLVQGVPRLAAGEQLEGHGVSGQPQHLGTST